MSARLLVERRPQWADAIDMRRALADSDRGEQW